MSLFITILCLVFTATCSHSSVVEESLLNPEANIPLEYRAQPQPPLVLDDDGHFQHGKDIYEKWFKYVNSSSMLEGDPKWGDREWEPFSDGFGIWALFYRNGTPVKNYPPPSFSHRSMQRQFTYIIVKCYLEGDSYIDVYDDYGGVTPVGRIESDGNEKFQDPMIFFKESGSYNFNITLHLGNANEVILIDSITLGDDVPVPTTTLSPKYCHEDLGLDKESDTQRSGWSVEGPSDFLKYFKEMSDLKEWWSDPASGHKLPPEFNLTAYEDVQGIWLVYNYTEQYLFEFDSDYQMDDSLPTFKFFPLDEDAHYEGVDINCYLHGATTIAVDFESEHNNDTIIEFPSPLPIGWQNLAPSLPGEIGVRNFSIQVNLEPGGFAFIDKMVAIRSTSESDCTPETEKTTPTSTQKTSPEAQLQPPIVLDNDGHFQHGKDIFEKWFKYVNSSSMLEGDPKWGDREWEPFSDGFGIWALFYRNGTPVKNYPPPSFSHRSTSRSFRYIIVKCYLEGDSYIDVYDDNGGVTPVGRIENDGNEKFQDPMIFFKESGSYNFNITLHLGNANEVILIDSITLSDDMLVSTTTTSLSTVSEGLEVTTETEAEKTPTTNDGWPVSTEEDVVDNESTVTVTDNWESSTTTTTFSDDESTESTENSGTTTSTNTTTITTTTTEHNKGNHYCPIQSVFLVTILTVVVIFV